MTENLSTNEYKSLATVLDISYEVYVEVTQEGDALQF